MADLLAALNTGHDGGCGTLHANRPAEVPARLEALGVAAGLDRAAVHSQAAAALAVVVHLRRTPAGRRVDELGVVRRAGDLVTVEPGWRADGGPLPRPPDRLRRAARRPGARAVTGALLAAALAVAAVAGPARTGPPGGAGSVRRPGRGPSAPAGRGSRCPWLGRRRRGRGRRGR